MYADNEKRIEQQQRINEIERDNTATVNEQQAAIEALRIEEELLDAARAQGLTITPELTAKIKEQAQAMAVLGLANANAKDALAKFNREQQKDIDFKRQLAAQYAQIAGSAISGFISDLRNGVKAGDAFNNMINRIVDSLIQMAIQMLIVKPLTNMFSTMMGVPATGFAAGGTVGLSRHGDGRNLPAAMWAGAPRFAAGGMVGLRPGEVPIIAHKGEVIIPATKRVGAGSGAVVNNYNNQQLGPVSIDMSQSGYVAADNDSAKTFGENVRKLIHVEMVRESRPGGLLRRV